jgi:hypothetical protein
MAFILSDKCLSLFCWYYATYVLLYALTIEREDTILQKQYNRCALSLVLFMKLLNVCT